ncbi:hypothetical protein CRM22_005266 [Opisthorchis felineus]|uniref:Uncharacterized protein n=1 Tax=Opisthorchis felineus TaxID=147828 RepID=A0A4S2LRY3_OPIFE|nr:hypothetical protein CRM22_005266 [Opisthorchis felineus]TGZ66548.1 hypothetical protein CRM22_005266 [Opisthorchis felineus]TGZ66549.1 hypothetical protein CRM22_005266 [Opisthorchis felineus]TGZ66550.1 hypothetical protein CRM22_005266 [Opisthorchis felineus]TGZ66551.1 hypothetical protein CRM22_005266 [Opisthorchis felineus]
MELEHLVQSISQALSTWAKELSHLGLACERCKRVQKEVAHLSSGDSVVLESLPALLLSSSLKISLGCAQENCFDTLDQLRCSVLNVLDRLNSLRSYLIRSISPTACSPNDLIELLQTLTDFQSAVVDEYDSAQLYQHDTVMSFALKCSQPYPTFDPSISLIHRIWNEEILDKFYVLGNRS